MVSRVVGDERRGGATAAGLSSEGLDVRRGGVVLTLEHVSADHRTGGLTVMDGGASQSKLSPNSRGTTTGSLSVAAVRDEKCVAGASVADALHFAEEVVGGEGPLLVYEEVTTPARASGRKLELRPEA